MLREFSIAFVILGICVVIHTAAIVNFAYWLIHYQDRIEKRASTSIEVLLLVSLFAVIIALHLIETAIWALFYYWHNLFPNFETALYFSLGTYSTIGYGDVVLDQKWRLLGGIEGISGVLLCGLSAAFIFAIVNARFQSRRR
jgi:voltage-gated potassium channel